MEMSSIFFSVDLAIGSYRHAVSTVIPRTTKVAWHLKREELKKSHPSETKSQFMYNVSGSAYRKEWGHVYETPSVFARLKAVVRIVPKIGPFSSLAFHPPTPSTEQRYMSSFNEALERYRSLLTAQRESRLQLPDDNLDTGAMTAPAAYRLTDETYARLLNRTRGNPIPNALRHDILSYYADLNRPFATKRHPKQWQELVHELDALKATPDGSELSSSGAR
jgi:hypothetical protein